MKYHDAQQTATDDAEAQIVHVANVLRLHEDHHHYTNKLLRYHLLAANGNKERKRKQNASELLKHGTKTGSHHGIFRAQRKLNSVFPGRACLNVTQQQCVR